MGGCSVKLNVNAMECSVRIREKHRTRDKPLHPVPPLTDHKGIYAFASQGLYPVPPGLAFGTTASTIGEPSLPRLDMFVSGKALQVFLFTVLYISYMSISHICYAIPPSGLQLWA